MLIALIVTVVASLAQHLGLSEAIAKVFAKVTRCPKCLTFWAVMLTLLLVSAHPIVAITLSMLCSYLSNWLGLLLMWLAKIYNMLWQRINER